MAFSPAPTSPTAPSGSAQQPGRRSTSPPAQPLSKRDKRRTALQERLQDLTNSFAQNRDVHFRQQLHALQYDMNLIIQADPYNPEPLDDGGEEIARLVETASAGNSFSTEMSSLAGRWYSKFVQEINEAKEVRDAELTMLMNRHQDNLARLKQECDFKLHLAAEECDQLASTLRERLVQSISHKRARLLKEKEQLDIADTNALLLHPSQFSITNPASPGGAQSNRKTRHTRHRVDLEDLGNGIVTENLNKRKRKAPLDDDLGSPGREGGFSTPAERSKARMTAHQTAPLYSINSLFTEKELAMHSNNAHVATVHFFATSKRNNINNGNGSGAATNGPNTDGESSSGSVDGTGHSDNEGAATLAAPEMDRAANSQSFHATRSTRNQAGMAGLNLLGDLADKAATRPNLPYYTLGSYHPRPNGAAPPPPALMPDEIDKDLAELDRLANKPAGWVDKGLLEELCAPVSEEKSRSTLHPDFPPAMDVHMVEMSTARSSLSEQAKRRHLV